MFSSRLMGVPQVKRSTFGPTTQEVSVVATLCWPSLVGQRKKSTKRSETSRLMGRESQSQVRRLVVAPSRLVGAPISREGRRGVVIVLNWRDIECRLRFFGPQVGRGDKSGGSRLVASRDIECRLTLNDCTITRWHPLHAHAHVHVQCQCACMCMCTPLRSSMSRHAFSLACVVFSL